MIQGVVFAVPLVLLCFTMYVYIHMCLVCACLPLCARVEARSWHELFSCSPPQFLSLGPFLNLEHAVSARSIGPESSQVQPVSITSALGLTWLSA